ncbi:MAG: hypothetical protein P1U38_09845 [Aeromicrobium sp.]|uniref:hypothetical protein n=1 Tax=Aeromicrobium sp. TaxID=1871063 RepID=UPI002605399A|nr:hypothetical protein [Aeromicrobium sp.]MDF1705064.1 hypothetical protein [Aeromicrobium sp.]
MSADVRQLIAEAASTVKGVTGYPYFVQSTAPGSTEVRLERIDYPNAFGGVGHWNVVVLLPQDMAQAEKYLDDVVLAKVVPAVAEQLVVTSVVPQRTDFPGAGVLLAAFINGHREE